MEKKSTVGVDVRNEHIFSNALGIALTSPHKNVFSTNHPFTKEDNRLLSTAFVDLSKNIQRFYFSFGASASYTSQFDFRWFGGGDISYDVFDNLRLYTSANTAVRLPTFTDLYLQNSIQNADPNLLPEKSTSIEAGIKFDKSNVELNGSTFYRMGENVID